MSIIRVIFELLVLYLLYKLIFDFIIPVYKTSKKVKKQFGEMNAKMQEQMNAYNQQQNAQSSKSKPEPVKKEDYIDYEEVK